MASLVSRFARLGMIRVQTLNSSYTTMMQDEFSNQSTAARATSIPPVQDQFKNPAASKYSGPDAEILRHWIGDNVSRKDKIKILVSTLIDINDNKEDIYGTLDAWVAWEQNFPIASLKNVLISLEKQYQWHRIVQVIKWMLSKGQGTTNGTYEQLIRALDMDQRAEEAHKFWMKKIGTDLHSVPWQLCKVMISIYHRNNMPERLIKLFRGIEGFDRKPPEKSIVRKVADAYEILGFLEEKDRVLEKYKNIFSEAENGKSSKFRKASSKKKNKSGKRGPDAAAAAARIERKQKRLTKAEEERSPNVMADAPESQ